MGENELKKIARAVAAFDGFSKDNDPHLEHNFGAITIAGEKLFWKVDYFDHRLKCLSPDPASAQHTQRLLTILLANEY